MKIMVISDLHNDVYATKKILSLFDIGKYDKLYILGDILYDCIKLLNPIHEKIVAVKGNCDSMLEEETALFSMPIINYDYQFGKVIVLTHGHYYDEFTITTPYDILITGHTHCSRIIKKDVNHLLLNPGSISKPRDSHASYMTIDENEVKIIDLDSNKIINSYKFKGDN